jgi:hypothetical protein
MKNSRKKLSRSIIEIRKYEEKISEDADFLKNSNKNLKIRKNFQIKRNQGMKKKRDGRKRQKNKE